MLKIALLVVFFVSTFTLHAARRHARTISR